MDGGLLSKIEEVKRDWYADNTEKKPSLANFYIHYLFLRKNMSSDDRMKLSNNRFISNKEMHRPYESQITFASTGGPTSPIAP